MTTEISRFVKDYPDAPRWAIELMRELPALVPKIQAQELLNRSDRAFSADIRAGRLQAIKMNPAKRGQVLIPRSELVLFLMSCRLKPSKKDDDR